VNCANPTRWSVPARRLAALLLVALLHALALPAAAAMPAHEAAGDCGHCQGTADEPCLMSAAGDPAAGTDATAARDRPRSPGPVLLPLLVLPPVVAAPPGTTAPILATGAAASGRATGDPPRHLRLGRLHN
jgi:hypothetical protein